MPKSLEQSESPDGLEDPKEPTALFIATIEQIKKTGKFTKEEIVDAYGPQALPYL